QQQNVQQQNAQQQNVQQQNVQQQNVQQQNVQQQNVQQQNAQQQSVQQQSVQQQNAQQQSVQQQNAQQQSVQQQSAQHQSTQQQVARKYGPQWKTGNSWIVETTNLQSQNAQTQTKTMPVRWKFEVKGIATLANHSCFLVEITCMEKGECQPHVYIWVDEVSGMLMRTLTYTWIKGRWHEHQETYIPKGGKSVAVFGSVPSLPLDMPVFGVRGAKSMEADTYETVTGPTGQKAIGQSGFVYQVKQSISPVSKELDKRFQSRKAKGAKSVSLKEAIEVGMNGGLNEVRQVWTPGTPWPVYSTNGASESRLVETNY
ncbi:MAG: hypothetical protein PHQ75_15180, partial [Thermoguttaceae bacterium]|nr:hypothetical protein [Thermoguttaceae bacterium]